MSTINWEATVDENNKLDIVDSSGRDIRVKLPNENAARPVKGLCLLTNKQLSFGWFIIDVKECDEENITVFIQTQKVLAVNVFGVGIFVINGESKGKISIPRRKFNDDEVVPKKRFTLLSATGSRGFYLLANGANIEVPLHATIAESF